LSSQFTRGAFSVCVVWDLLSLGTDHADAAMCKSSKTKTIALYDAIANQLIFLSTLISTDLPPQNMCAGTCCSLNATRCEYTTTEPPQTLPTTIESNLTTASTSASISAANSFSSTASFSSQVTTLLPAPAIGSDSNAVSAEVLGGAIGGALAGVVLIILLVIGCVAMRKRNSADAKAAAAVAPVAAMGGGTVASDDAPAANNAAGTVYVAFDDNATHASGSSHYEESNIHQF
jgi:hypothetical protein